LGKNSIQLKRKENKALKVIVRILCVLVLVTVIFLSVFAWYFNFFENNPLDFKANTRIHAVRPYIFDEQYRAGTLVFVRPMPIRTVEQGTLISMAYNNEVPLIFNNELFVEFIEEYYGMSLHGIVTERTLERGRSPLRAGRYIGVPYGSIPFLGTVLLWIVSNTVIFISLAILLTAAAVTAFILCRRRN